MTVCGTVVALANKFLRYLSKISDYPRFWFRFSDFRFNVVYPCKSRAAVTVVNKGLTVYFLGGRI